MLRAGDVYRVEIPGEKTDHFWIMITEMNSNGEIAYAMLTDARNLDYPLSTFSQATPAWENFEQTKDTAVDAAWSGIRSAATVEKVLNAAGKYQGAALPNFLESVRNALRSAPETPNEVKKAL